LIERSQLGTRLSYGPISISTRIVGILATTAIIVRQFGIVTGGITIALDGESAPWMNLVGNGLS